MPLAALIPMTTLAAVLLVVAANMADWKSFFILCKNAPKSDIIVLVATFLLTVFFDLVVAIEVGVVLAALLFMKRMAETSDVKVWKYSDAPDVTPGEAEKLRDITIIFSHVNEQPMHMMEKGDFVEIVGKENFQKNIVEALDYAETLVAQK